MNHKITVVLFFLLVCLPGAQLATGVYNVAPVNENRKLAPWPTFSREAGVHAALDGLQKWFDDHMGFRGFLIRLKTQIDYSLFGFSTQIHIGKDGWLYYRSVVDREKPHIDWCLRGNVGRVVAGTKGLNEELRRKGIALILLPIPLKNYFYPQYLPTSAPRLPSPTQFDLTYEGLRAIPDLFFVDVITLLKREAEERPIFHKTDFHWNDPAAFGVAKWIVDEISRREGLRESVWKHPLKISVKEMSGGQATFLPLFVPPRERALFIDPTWQNLPADSHKATAPFDWLYRMKKPSANLLPPIAVIGDSFFDGINRSGFHQQFNVVYMARRSSATLRDVLDHLPADTRYVLVEFIEVSLGALNDLAEAGRGLCAKD